MKRISTSLDHLNNGAADVDWGDGSTTRIPIGVIPGQAQIDAAAFAKPVDNVTTDLNAYQTVGLYEVTKSGVANRPLGAAGVMRVSKIGTRIVQEWTTTEAAPRSYVRSYDGMVWGSWVPTGWRGTSVTSGADLNAYTTVGYYEVPNGNNANRPPGATVGALEVLTVGLIALQRFTTAEATPRTFVRKFQSSAWSEWSLDSPTSDIPTPAPETDPSVPTRAPFGTWDPVITGSASGDIIQSVSTDRVTGFNGQHPTGRLKVTSDYGATWTEIHQFATALMWVRQLDNGELLAAVGLDPAPRELWLSSGYPSGSATWTKVLTGSAPAVTFTTSWSLSIVGNMIVIGEYGPKMGATWNGVTVDDGKNARYVYLSTDYGKTFRQVFDLNTYLTGRGASSLNGQHVHGVAWDRYWDRLWVTFGDDTNGILYSDDLGATWQTADFGPLPGSPRQVVGIAPMPKAILFGTDTAPNGVMRVTRDQGKKATGTYAVDQAFTVPGDDGSTRTNLAQQILTVNWGGGDPLTLIGFSAETNPGKSFIAATRDGLTVSLFWIDSVTQAAGFGLRTIAGPLLNGELVVGANDQRFTGQWTKMQGKAPLY